MSEDKSVIICHCIQKHLNFLLKSWSIFIRFFKKKKEVCTKDTSEKSTTEEKRELLKKKICVTGCFKPICYQQSLVFEPYVILVSTVVPPGTVK